MAMDPYDIAYANQHLTELIDRAARGEEVSITDPERGTFRLQSVSGAVTGNGRRRPILGQWQGRLTVPMRLFEPLSGDELAYLSGEQSG